MIRRADLGDGLVLRPGRPEDADELADFNVRMHSDSPDDPELSLRHWTRELMSGEHPTVGPSDFTVVVDESAGGKIVSTAVHISQRWSYGGVEFPFGRPELIATDPDYRRRGLVRKQMDALHELSASRGELAQGITGIPWYYRMFGYEMGLNLGGIRLFFWARAGNDKAAESEPFRLREAKEEDIPALAELYAIHTRNHSVVALRDEARWRWEIGGRHPDGTVAQHHHIIETPDGETVGYLDFQPWPGRIAIRELAVMPGRSLRAVCLFLTREMKRRADELNETWEEKKRIRRLALLLGPDHPAYTALGRQLERMQPPYAWYVRVPDLPAFLRHIAPALERRLAESVVAGHSGSLDLNFYTSTLSMKFEKGKLAEVGTFEPKQLESGHALFPDLTFLKLLFGHRSLDELMDSRADLYAMNTDAVVLLDALFPKRPSNPSGIG